jgi:hypothetical protein
VNGARDGGMDARRRGGGGGGGEWNHDPGWVTLRSHFSE